MYWSKKRMSAWCVPGAIRSDHALRRARHVDRARRRAGRAACRSPRAPRTSGRRSWCQSGRSCTGFGRVTPATQAHARGRGAPRGRGRRDPARQRAARPRGGRARPTHHSAIQSFQTWWHATASSRVRDAAERLAEAAVEHRDVDALGVEHLDALVGVEAGRVAGPRSAAAAEVLVRLARVAEPARPRSVAIRSSTRHSSYRSPRSSAAGSRGRAGAGGCAPTGRPARRRARPRRPRARRRRCPCPPPFVSFGARPCLSTRRQSKHRSQLSDVRLEVVTNQHAANTTRAYRADWEDFGAWCTTHRRRALPATVPTVAAYLRDVTRERRPSTVRRRLAAIHSKHVTAGVPSPAIHTEVRVVAAGPEWRGRRLRRPTQPLHAPELFRCSAVLPDTIAGRRDRAVLLVAYGAALRRTELVALDASDLWIGRDGALRVRVAAWDGARATRLERHDLCGAAVVGLEAGRRNASTERSRLPPHRPARQHLADAPLGPSGDHHRATRRPARRAPPPRTLHRPFTAPRDDPRRRRGRHPGRRDHGPHRPPLEAPRPRLPPRPLTPPPGFLRQNSRLLRAVCRRVPRRRPLSPLEELDATLAAIDRSELNAFSYVDPDATRPTRRSRLPCRSAACPSASRSSNTSRAGRTPKPRSPCANTWRPTTPPSSPGCARRARSSSD